MERAGCRLLLDAQSLPHAGSDAKKWDWLYKGYILSLLSKNRKDWLRYYRKWVSIEEQDKVSQKISGVKWPVCIGPQAFTDRIKEKYGSKKMKLVISTELPTTGRSGVCVRMSKALSEDKDLAGKING